MTYDIDDDISNGDIEVEMTNKPKSFAQESVLELVETEEGVMVLRDVGDTEEPLLTIEFSKKVQDMLDGETYSIGQYMIHAAIQAVMKKQISQWHANVYDEEPEHFS